MGLATHMGNLLDNAVTSLGVMGSLSKLNYLHLTLSQAQPYERTRTKRILELSDLLVLPLCGVELSFWGLLHYRLVTS